MRSTHRGRTKVASGDYSTVTTQLYSEALPIPSAWFCVGVASEISRGSVTTRRLAGRDIVLFRTADGALAALDAHCPHLGAHMGKGGRVEGDSLRCPFHGFCFDARGTCVRTAYGTKPPRAARARAYPVLLLHGAVFAYFDPRGLEPGFRPESPDAEGWSPYRFHAWTLRGHPQETTENAVDIGHFAVVHGYRNVHERAPTTTSGPYLAAHYGFERPTLPLWGGHLVVREAIDVHVWGLGYSRVHVTDLSLGLDLRLLVLPTPVEADRIELRIGISVRDFRESPRLYRLLRHIPRAISHGLIARALLRIYQHEVERDFNIWTHKRYVGAPALAVGDGPVGLYRRWASQFYDGVTECRTKTSLHA
jgi:nitrite reductase/ring-hydroxylating ferredoxin subunit